MGGIITYSPYRIWYDKTKVTKKKKKKKRQKLQLLNHEYSNMNIPYINEIRLLYYCAKTTYTYLLNV